MIRSFRDKWLSDFFLEDRRHKKIPSSIDERLFRKLQLIDDATCGLDLRSPPSNHFEKLSGNLAGKHSVRINKQWRLVFEWDEEQGAAFNISGEALIKSDEAQAAEKVFRSVAK